MISSTFRRFLPTTLESFIHNFDNFLQSMAPGAAGDDKSKEEEKKVKETFDMLLLFD